MRRRERCPDELARGPRAVVSAAIHPRDHEHAERADLVWAVCVGLGPGLREERATPKDGPSASRPVDLDEVGIDGSRPRTLHQAATALRRIGP